MGLHETLVLVVVYPGSEKYFQEYAESINNQSNLNFDLLVLNDGIQELPTFDFKYFLVTDVEPGLTVAEIRMKGIQYALKCDYKYLIFSDIDDFYSKNRIEKSLVDLTGGNFVYNALIPVDDISKLVNISTGIKFPEQLTSHKNILDYNVVGMSNSAIDLTKFGGFYIPKDIIAVDWWLFTIQLILASRGKYVEEAITFYRQSDDNLLGMNKSLNVDRLEFGLRVKRLHFQHVQKYCEMNKYDVANKDYSGKLDEIHELTSMLGNPEFKEHYIKVINNNIDDIYKGWWSEILSMENWRKYE
jgi:hypothetical protein